MSIRVMGRATFAHIQDGSGRIQIYLRQDEVGSQAYQFLRKGFDLGDFVGVEGGLFRTRTGEVTQVKTRPEESVGLLSQLILAQVDLNASSAI